MTQENNQPLYRVSFAPFKGKDNRGQDIVGYPREIGAVWPRKNGKPGAILDLELIPFELIQHQGVIFLNEIGSYGDSEPQS